MGTGENPAWVYEDEGTCNKNHTQDFKFAPEKMRVTYKAKKAKYSHCVPGEKVGVAGPVFEK